MKVKIKKTGEIVNVSDYATIDLDYCNSYGNPVIVSLKDVEFIKETPEFTSVWHEASEKPQGCEKEEILVQFNDLTTDVFELEDYEYLDNVNKWAFTKDLLSKSK